MNKVAQAVNGMLLLNKSKDFSSNQALQAVKRLYGARKAGHTGSLDPLATGMLPICFGEATKFSQYQLTADKCYRVTGLLGIETDTADATGKVTQIMDTFEIEQDVLLQVLQEFQGTITQVPSIYSALKYQGKPLYHYARAGIDVPRTARDISIHALKLNFFDGKHINLTVICSKGTYIRNLIEDIGRCLEVGAHVIQLHREYTSGFENLPMYTLDELSQMSEQERMQILLPVHAAIAHFPVLVVSDAEKQALAHGQLIQPEHQLEPGLVQLFDYNGQLLLGVGEVVDGGAVKAKRLCQYMNS